MGKWEQKLVVGDTRQGCFVAGLTRAVGQLGGLRKKRRMTLRCRGYAGFHAPFLSLIEQQHLNPVFAIEGVGRKTENEYVIEKTTWTTMTQTKNWQQELELVIADCVSATEC